MLWTWMMACGLQPWSNLEGDSEEAFTPGDALVEFDPAELDFGDQSVDSGVTRFLTVMNNGGSDVVILEASRSASSGLDLSAPDTLMVSPGSETLFTVTWTPQAVGQLSTDLMFEFDSSTDGVFDVTVPVSGAGQGPVLTMSTDNYDFGDVNVGCEEELSLTISNAGNQDLEIDDFILGGETSYTWELEDEDPPWTLGPFESRDIHVVFSPDQTTTDAAVLDVMSGDEILSAVMTGNGTVDGSETVIYVVGEQNYATFLFAVNAAVTPGAYDYYGFGANLETSLPTFFQTLLDNNVTFRAAFMWETTGSIQGSYDYIDDTFSASDATSAALSMLSGASGDNDTMFTTLNAGIAQNSDWLFEDDRWSESRLSLIALNNDTEQSGGSFKQYVTTAQAYKEDKDDVVYHGIGGPSPSGCTYADPFSGYMDAISMTGGLLMNICDTDWDPHMEKLAAAGIEGASNLFPLTGTPLVSSISITLDGFPESDGWEYDADLNAVIFDDDSLPLEGTTVEISFQTSNGCD